MARRAWIFLLLLLALVTLHLFLFVDFSFVKDAAFAKPISYRGDVSETIRSQTNTNFRSLLQKSPDNSKIAREKPKASVAAKNQPEVREVDASSIFRNLHEEQPKHGNISHAAGEKDQSLSKNTKNPQSRQKLPQSPESQPEVKQSPPKEPGGSQVSQQLQPKAATNEEKQSETPVVSQKQSEIDKPTLKPLNDQNNSQKISKAPNPQAQPEVPKDSQKHPAIPPSPQQTLVSKDSQTKPEIPPKALDVSKSKENSPKQQVESNKVPINEEKQSDPLKDTLQQPKPPEIKKESAITANPQKTLEVRQVVFAKVHKAASSTVQNILFRFSLSRNLSVILPRDRGSIFGERSSKLSPKNVIQHPEGKPFDILCSHIIYDEREISKYFSSDAVRVAILREPMRHALSALQYYTRFYPTYQLRKGVRKYHDDPINGYLRHPEEFYTPASWYGPLSSYINNRMSLDLGFEYKKLEESKKNKTKIQLFLTKLDETFDIVLISDYFDESMVLLRRYLNWPLKDVISIKVNTAKSDKTSVWRHKPVLNDSVIKAFRQWDAIDYEVYEHFLPKFQKLIEREQSFKEEVEAFRIIQKKVSDYCLYDKSNNSLTISKSVWTTEFGITKYECKLMTLSEIDLANIVRKKQMEYYAKYKAQHKETQLPTATKKSVEASRIIDKKKEVVKTPKR